MENYLTSPQENNKSCLPLEIEQSTDCKLSTSSKNAPMEKPNSESEVYIQHSTHWNETNLSHPHGETNQLAVQEDDIIVSQTPEKTKSTESLPTNKDCYKDVDKCHHIWLKRLSFLLLRYLMTEENVEAWTEMLLSIKESKFTEIKELLFLVWNALVSLVSLD